MEHFGQFITNHWVLWLALLGVLLLIFINETLNQKNRTNELSPQAAVNKINHDNAIVIDIRDKDLYVKGHIIDSLHANSDSFDQKNMNKYKKKPIILACAKGISSATLAAKIRAQGYEDVYVLQGGIDAWQNADLPLVKK